MLMVAGTMNKVDVGMLRQNQSSVSAKTQYIVEIEPYPRQSLGNT